MQLKKKFVILDNSDYTAYFLSTLGSEYAPITLNDKTRSLLEAHGIKAVGILDYLDFETLKGITEVSFTASERLLGALDGENRDNYSRIFGTRDIPLMDGTVGYLFKRFTIAALRLVYGLEAILARHPADEIAYLHDGKPRILCGTKKERGFFFPDDITAEILKNWKHEAKPDLNFIRAPREILENPAKKRSPRLRLLDMNRRVRTLLSPLKKAIFDSGRRLANHSEDKESILFLAPLCDFKYISASKALKEDYDILVWDADSETGLSSEEGEKAPYDVPLGLSFEAAGFDNAKLVNNLDFKKLAIPLIKDFYEKKLPDILRYWNQAKGLYQNHDILVLFWGNSPHRYPHGIVKEFFRSKGVPIFGMQYGGLTGSNNEGRSIIEKDYKNCDYYLSFGFKKENLEGDIGKTSVIPTGSVALKRFYTEYEESGKRKKMDLIFPISLARGNFYYENEITSPRLFAFQKRIIDLLAEYAERKKILLKFPIGTYLENPLGTYIEKKHPDGFLIVDHISFSDCMKEYEAHTILIEEQSTPLNEALVTKSNIIVYNNASWAGLTKPAFELLSKRAIVCGTEDEFLKKTRYALDRRLEKKDIENKEFMEKYCIYRGDPEENVEHSIRSFLNDSVKESELAHAK